MTIRDRLDSMVGADDVPFADSTKTDAITTAKAVLDTTDSSIGQHQVATAMLAQRILLNAAKSMDEQVTLSDLITDEIRSLMAEDEKDKSYKVIHYKKPTVDWRS